MANLHIPSPGYREGVEVSGSTVGSIKIRASLNPDNPTWLFMCGLSHFIEQQEVARGLGKEWAYFAPPA